MGRTDELLLSGIVKISYHGFFDITIYQITKGGSI